MKSAKDEKKSRRLAKSVLSLIVRGGYRKVIIFTEAQDFHPLAPSCVSFQSGGQSHRPLVVSEEEAPFLIHGIKEIARIENAEAQIGQIPLNMRDELLDLTFSFIIEVRVVNDKKSEKLVLSIFA